MEVAVHAVNCILLKTEDWKSYKVKPSNIQHAHRLGKPKGPDGKPRQIICRFKDYHLRQAILIKESCKTTIDIQQINHLSQRI